MSYVSWTIVAMLALAAIVVFLFVPGLAVLAAIGLALVLVLGVVLFAARGVAGAGDTTPDVMERRDEHHDRQRDRRRAG